MALKQCQFLQIAGGQGAAFVDKIPDTCPICHMGIVPQPIVADGEQINNREDFELVFRCSKAGCGKFFIAMYHFAHEPNGNPQRTINWTLGALTPQTAPAANYGDVLSELSPTAIQILNQAALARANNLDQLVGIGLRKALEFMVKDFAIRQHPTQVEEIKKKMLGACIETYITDASVKACAKRAAWLGNDETHYTRKWVDRDIQDLDRLIKLTMNAIENVILTERYLTEMPES